MYLSLFVYYPDVCPCVNKSDDNAGNKGREGGGVKMLETGKNPPSPLTCASCIFGSFQDGI